MSMPPLNLASRPFRNERLVALLIAFGFTVAGAITVRHAMAIRALMPGRTSGLARQVQQLEDERSRVQAEVSSLRAPRPEPGVMEHWALLKELVDRRTFAWSGLFAVLEETLPRGVRLVSIAPSVRKGDIVVELVAITRSNDDALELITALQKRPEFEDVLPRARSGQEELNFRVTMKYTPRPAAAVAMASSAAAVPPSDPAASPGAAASPAVAASPAGAAVASASPGAPTPDAAGAAPRAGAGRGRTRATREGLE